MNSLKKTALATSILLVTGAASASNMYIDLGTNVYDTSRYNGVPDLNTTTASFEEFGYNQIKATSIYDLTDSSVLGYFYDTNIPSELAAVGIPISGTAMDSITNVSLVMPDCTLGQCDIDGLSPLVPPLITDNEGFLQTWDLQVEYHFDGVLNASGPVYTGGYLNIYFNDRTLMNNDRLVITGTLTGSDIMAANLNLFFDITYAEAGWLWIQNDNGDWVDANEGTVSGNYAELVIDTNVEPPIPTADQLLVVVVDEVTVNAIRQADLDGSATASASIPEPSTIAMMGLGLLGFGAMARRRAKQ